jgi:CHAT domain-containing protein
VAGSVGWPPEATAQPPQPSPAQRPPAPRAQLPNNPPAQEPLTNTSCVAPTAAPAAEPASQAGKALARGNALQKEGKPTAALAAYHEARQLAEADSDPRLTSLARANAARAAIEAGQSQVAASELSAVTAEVADFRDTATRAHLLIHLARSYALLAERDPARTNARVRAAELLNRAAEAAANAGDDRQRSYALGYQAELYEREGRRGEALTLASRALRAGIAADAPDAVYRWQWLSGRIERAQGDSNAALTSYRAAATTVSQLRRELALSPVDFREVLGQDQNQLYQELVDLLLRATAREKDATRKQALLSEARNTLELQKNDELRDYFRDECLAVFQATAPDTIPGAVVIYPVPLDDRLEIIVGGAGSLRRYATPVDQETLAAEVQALRRQLSNRTSLDYELHAETIYDWLIRPIQPFLEETQPETLVFVPSGMLRTIPMGALSDPDTRRFLVEKYPLAIIPSLTLTDPRPIQRDGMKLLAAGLSESVGGYTALGNVERELEAVEETFPSRSLVNRDFVAARFEREVETRPFGIVHIASHGEFADDPSESFLLTYDGELSMDRLARAVSTTQYRQDQPLELLTLSACETAAGNDRAALGLAGIAVRSGARSALATLWAVEDRAASELVMEFYAQLKDPATSRAQALQRAQLKLLTLPVFQHPGYWSPFILINSWL